jgi:two-component system, LytTR family, response regulator
MMRVLLVDDEEPTRQRLRDLMACFEDLEIVGEAEDGEQAIERILALRPDLVFLDVQMPGCSGLEVVNSLPIPRPKVIFCTAFDQYAVTAFDLHAVDYILKPVNRARLARAVDRARRAVPEDGDSAIERAVRNAGGPPERILAKRGARFHVIPRHEILYFSAEDGLVRLHTADQQFLAEPTLAELEQRFEAAGFLRISRTAIVRLDAVAEVLPMVGGSGEVAMKNGARLEVSRRRFKELLDALRGPHAN